jgi:hypothetical protein
MTYLLRLISYGCDEIKAVYVPVEQQSNHNQIEVYVTNLTFVTQPAVIRHTFGSRRKVLDACVETGKGGTSWDERARRQPGRD